MLTETDDSESMPLGSSPVLTKASFVMKLATPIQNVFHHSLAQGLEVPADVSLGENARNKEFYGAKKEQDHFAGQAECLQDRERGS